MLSDDLEVNRVMRRGAGSPYLEPVIPDVVVVDHHDSYTWNLVHLVASVTGVLPTVVQHDEVEPDEVLRHSHVVLSPGPGTPVDARRLLGRSRGAAGRHPPGARASASGCRGW